MSDDRLRTLVDTAKLIKEDIESSSDPNEKKRLQAKLDVIVAALKKERDKVVSDESGDTYSKLGSAGMGFLGGISLDYADEIGGGLQSLFGEGTYEQYRDSLRAEFEQAQSDNPGSYLTGEIGSAFVPGAGAPGLLAKTGKLGKKVFDGNKWASAAASGATESGLASIGSSTEQGMDSVNLGTLGDAVGGAGFGTGLQAAGTGGMKVLDSLVTSTQAKANRGVRNALNNDGIHTQDQLRNLGGPETIIADAGPNTRSLARQIGNMQGEGKARMDRVLRERNDTAPQRVQDSLDRNTSGTGTTAEQKLSAVEQAAKDEAAPLYKRAYEKDITPEQAQELAPILGTPMGKAALKEAKTLMENSLDPLMGRDPTGAGVTPRLLHYAMMSLQETANKAKRAEGSDVVYAQAVAMKNALRDIVVRGNPDFANAQKIWADKSAFGRAVDLGQGSLGANRRAADITGEYRSLPKAEQGGFQVGLSDQLALRLERLGDTTTGQKLGASNKIVRNDGEREIIREIFGRDGLLIRDLESEAMYKQTYNDVLSGSRTAADMADTAEGVLPDKTQFVQRVMRTVMDSITSRFGDESRRKALEALSKRISRMSYEEVESLLKSGKMEKMVSNLINAGQNGRLAGRLSDSANKEVGFMERFK